MYTDLYRDYPTAQSTYVGSDSLPLNRKLYSLKESRVQSLSPIDTYPEPPENRAKVHHHPAHVEDIPLQLLQQGLLSSCSGTQHRATSKLLNNKPISWVFLDLTPEASSRNPKPLKP